MLNRRSPIRGPLPSRLIYALALLFLAAYVIILQVPWSPPNHKIHVDGTFYAYGGERILEGELPYRDFWDPKPPGIFYLNALAFLLWGADAWSVWYLTVLWTLGIAFSFFWLLRRLLPAKYALLGTVVLVASLLQPEFYEGSNLIEFYGILPATLAIGFTHSYLSHGRSSSALGLGAAFASGLLLKHTNVATATACIGIILFLDIRRAGFKLAGRTLLLIAAPVVTSLAAVVVFFWAHNSAGLLWEANVKYAILYSEGNWGFRSLYGAFRSIATKPTLVPLLTLAASAALVQVISRGRWLANDQEHSSTHQPAATEWTYVAVSISLILEIVFLSLLGSRFGHYYMSSLPALTFSAFYWFRSTSPVWTRSESTTLLSSVALSIGWAAIAIWSIAIIGLVRPTTDDIRSFIADAPSRHPLRTDVGKYVIAHTGPEDTVLVWGIGAEVNFETHRRFPTRYVFSTHLFQANIPAKERWEEFLSTLESNRPSLIITQWKSGYAPMLEVSGGDLAAECKCDGEFLEGFAALTEFVKANYDRELILGDKFAAYHLRNP